MKNLFKNFYLLVTVAFFVACYFVPEPEVPQEILKSNYIFQIGTAYKYLVGGHGGDEPVYFSGLNFAKFKTKIYKEQPALNSLLDNNGYAVDNFTFPIEAYNCCVSNLATNRPIAGKTLTSEETANYFLKEKRIDSILKAIGYFEVHIETPTEINFIKIAKADIEYCLCKRQCNDGSFSEESFVYIKDIKSISLLTENEKDYFKKLFKNVGEANK